MNFDEFEKNFQDKNPRTKHNLVFKIAKEAAKNLNPIIAFTGGIVVSGTLIILIFGGFLLAMQYSFFRFLLSVLLLSILILIYKLKQNGRRKKNGK